MISSRLLGLSSNLWKRSLKWQKPISWSRCKKKSPTLLSKTKNLRRNFAFWKDSNISRAVSCTDWKILRPTSSRSNNLWKNWDSPGRSKWTSQKNWGQSKHQSRDKKNVSKCWSASWSRTKAWTSKAKSETSRCKTSSNWTKTQNWYRGSFNWSRISKLSSRRIDF